MTNFIETKLRGTPKEKKNRRGKKNRRRERVLSMEALQSRELMAADFSWLGDTLQVRGTDGNDFLFSDQATAVMDGGEGLDWIYDSQMEGVWEDALGVEGFDLDLSDLDAVPQFDSNDQISLQVELNGRTEIAGQSIDVSGAVEVSESGVNVHVAGSLDSWSDAFGVAGLELKDTQIVLDTSSDELAGDAYRVHVDSHLDTDGTLIGIAGTVDLAPETVDATFTGSIENWDDAFGIDDLDLQQAELSISGSVDEQSGSEFSIEIGADMLIDSTLVAVAGVLDISPERIDAQLGGSVENWGNAFGIEQLSLNNAHLNVVASTDRKEDHRVAVGVQADMRVENTDVEVAGSVEITPDNIDVVMTGNVPRWDDAFGVDDLDLEDANLTVLASTDREGSQELYVDVAAGMDLFGTYVGIGGLIQFTPNGVSTNLSGTVAGDWAGAFGIDALQLRDTELSIAHDPTDGDESGFNIELDTDLELFGSYVDVTGNLDFSLSGVSVSLSPPGELELENLLGISGFSLSGADVTLDAGTDGMSLSLDATMDMGSVEVDFEGLFSISQDEVSASLTGSIDRWDDAFDVSGLNLEDVVMTVGAEKSAAGASMFIGLGAGISIGDKEIEVAGVVGVGTTGWEVAFRGSIDVLASTDLVVFANTMTQAGDPDAKPIPSDALGDFEMQDAYINFAP